MDGKQGTAPTRCRIPTCGEVCAVTKKWLIGDRTTLTDHARLYLILGIVTANIDFSIPIMYMALGPYVEKAADVFELYDTRFYFVSQTLLFMPVICGYLTDYFGRYSHVVMIVCGVCLSVLQAMTLLPWGDFFPSEQCGVRGADGEISFCNAHVVLLTIFLVRGVFINQALDQMLKMLSVRASKQFPHDEERKEVEIQRTGTMSDASTSVIEGLVFGAAILMQDYESMRVFMTMVGCASTLIVAVLCVGYTARSFTISRSQQQPVPVETIAAKFTDGAESVAASVVEDRGLGLLSGGVGGGYGTAGFATGGGVATDLGATAVTDKGRGRAGDSSDDDDVVGDFRELRVAARGGASADEREALRKRSSVDSSSAAAESAALAVHVAGAAHDDSDAVICGQCLCCGFQCTGCSCGSRKTACGQFLSWASGMCYFAVTPVIALPFVVYLLMQLFNIIVTLPVPQQEAEYFNIQDDLAAGDDPAFAFDDADANAQDDFATDDALGPLTPPSGALMFRLARVIRTVNGQFASQSLIYLGGSAAYAAFIAEMKPFVFFRYAFPALCLAIGGMMMLFYVPDRPEGASTFMVGLTQVISYFLNEFLQWFLMAVVPESLFGLFTIAQGVGLALMGTAGSQLVRWDAITVIIFSQAILGAAAALSIFTSVATYNRLMRVAEDDEDDEVPAAVGGAAAKQPDNDIMRTARRGGYAPPGKSDVTEDPEKLAGAADDLFGDDLDADSRAPAAASLSGYHHTGSP